MTAQQNISRLPDYCWGVLLIDKSLIRIKAGEMGYYPLDEALSRDAKNVFSQYRIKGDKSKRLNNDAIADKLNADMGISKATRYAMEWGSQFGWEMPASRPEKWEEILSKQK